MSARIVSRRSHWSFSLAKTLFGSTGFVLAVGVGLASGIASVDGKVKFHPVTMICSASFPTIPGVVYMRKGSKYVPWDGSAGMVTYCQLKQGKRTVYAVRDTTDAKLAA